MGGYAVQGVRRITGDEARGTLQLLQQFLSSHGIQVSLLIGSAWSRTEGSSGDLDVGVSAVPKPEFTSFVASRIGHIVQGKSFPGISVYSFGFPIMGQASNGMVQVDLMPVYFKEWSKFVYAPTPGQMKSAHRNWVLWSLAKSKGILFDLNKGALRNGEHTADPEVFLNWIGISKETAESYETLSAVVPKEILLEAGQKLAAVK